jgi:hypothetical protein
MEEGESVSALGLLGASIAARIFGVALHRSCALSCIDLSPGRPGNGTGLARLGGS